MASKGREESRPYRRYLPSEIEKFFQKTLALACDVITVFMIKAAVIFFIIAGSLRGHYRTLKDFVEFPSIQPHPPTLWTVVDFDSLSV
jgi:hypothetical protein